MSTAEVWASRAPTKTTELWGLPELLKQTVSDERAQMPDVVDAYLSLVCEVVTHCCLNESQGTVSESIDNMCDPSDLGWRRVRQKHLKTVCLGNSKVYLLYRLLLCVLVNFLVLVVRFA